MMRTALVILMLAFVSFAAVEQLKPIDVKIEGGNCTNSPIVVTTKDVTQETPLRTEVRIQIGYYGMWNDVYVNWTDGTYGNLSWVPTQEGTYLLSVTRPGYYPYSTRFNTTFCPECTTDFDCRNTQACSNFTCVEVTGECGFVTDHAWHSYECCGNAACADDEHCSGNSCVKVTGDCGYAGGHTWNRYSCCADSDCGTGENCAEHACVRRAACEKDADCLASQRCASGACINLTGECGFASDHRWNSYGCCSDGSCPSNWCLDTHTCSPTARQGTGGQQQPPVGSDVCGGSGMLLVAVVLVAAALILVPLTIMGVRHKIVKHRPEEEEKTKGDDE